MTRHSLADTAQALVSAGKGLLAMDESVGTCNRRFAALGIAQTEEARRAYRQLLITAPGLGECISGAILHDETSRQKTQDGTPFVQALAIAGILPGIKVDTGTTGLAAHPGEQVTEGLDGLRARLKNYAETGARFAKWRAVISIAEGLPTPACIEANAQALARYAALCQESGLVPIVEPEVLMEGSHTLQQCGAVTHEVLHCVFDQLHRQGVLLEATILKPNMLLPGLSCEAEPTVDEVADATVQCLRRAVPAAVAGVAFLSGGQAPALATARLNAMKALHRSPRAGLPWPLTFSFARALQQPALAIWDGMPSQAVAAQQALLHRARCNSAAQRGIYTIELETA